MLAPPGLLDFYQHVKDVSRVYAEDWNKFAKVYESHGMYETISDRLNLSGRKIWLDCCCGTGNLISAGVRKTKARIIGFDFNQDSLDLAKKNLEQSRHKVNYSCEYSIQLDGPPFTFRRIPRQKLGYEIQDGINLIFEDIRSLNVLKKYLNDTSIDLLTLSCPGVAELCRYEGNFKLDYNHQPGKMNDEDRRRHKITERNVKKAMFKIPFLSDDALIAYIERVIVPKEIPAEWRPSQEQLSEEEPNKFAVQNGFVNFENEFVPTGIPLKDDTSIPMDLYKGQEVLMHLIIHKYKKVLKH